MMYPLFETIAIENGVPQRLALHQRRYEQSLRQFYGQFPCKDLCIQNLSRIIQVSEALNATNHANLIRCRISYNYQECKVEYFPYQRRTYRSFTPIICDEIEYGLKLSNRELINALFAERGDNDEIIIIKHGKVTDCSIGNLIFRRNAQWFTSDTPLLAGTQRANLIAQNKIQVCEIRLEDLHQFEEIRVINALNGL
ncbi:hypothetical protein B0188_04350 [[Haemophilus] felis]|uniref:Branched-chain amino acid aminotransferase n=1 Tax=[Haemophilus] felis TaxID=123822 RepID=A0A1T0B595_9PAST|nr:hypothetical protein B0188_04350 [[Haemophilus] felis]